MANNMLASIVDDVVCLFSLSLAMTLYIPDELPSSWQFKWNTHSREWYFVFDCRIMWSGLMIKYLKCTIIL